MPVTVRSNRAAGSGVFDYADDFPEGVNTLEGNRFGTTAFDL